MEFDRNQLDRIQAKKEEKDQCQVMEQFFKSQIPKYILTLRPYIERLQERNNCDIDMSRNNPKLVYYRVFLPPDISWPAQCSTLIENELEEESIQYDADYHKLYLPVRNQRN